MVSPARLVEVVSHVTGVPLPTVTDMDRRLVQAGLRNKGGRGFNAARMSTSDAAHLLTAILASPQSNLAAAAVTRYAETTVDASASSTARFGPLELDDLSDLTAAHSFVEGLRALLDSASRGNLSALLSPGSEGAHPRIEIYAFTRATRGRIRISGMPNGMTASLEYRPSPMPSLQTVATGLSGDLEQSRRITERTLSAIAGLLAKESPHA